MPDAAPDAISDLVSPPITIDAAWIDAYGHMNMAEYVRLFDTQCGRLLDRLDIGDAYTARARRGLFVLDVAVNYRRELVVGDVVQVELRLIEADDKRLVSLMALRDQADGEIVATQEQLAIHTDLDARRVTAFTPEQRERLAAAVARQAALPLPARHVRRFRAGPRRAD